MIEKFTVRAIHDRSLSRDVISLKWHDAGGSLNLRIPLDEAEHLIRKLTSSVVHAKRSSNLDNA